MALSTTLFYDRMDEDFLLLGDPSESQQKNILIDALNEYLKDMENPRTSASLSVTADEDTYSVPAGIDKIADVRNELGKSVNWELDQTVNEIVLQDAPGSDTTYTVYGTTKDVRTNIETVTAAVPENDESVLWELIRAFAHRWANSDQASKLLQEAKALAEEKKQSKNRSIGLARSNNVRHVDVRGRIIGDSDNKAGIDVDINDQFESDL